MERKKEKLISFSQVARSPFGKSGCAEGRGGPSSQMGLEKILRVFKWNTSLALYLCLRLCFVFEK